MAKYFPVNKCQHNRAPNTKKRTNDYRRRRNEQVADTAKELTKIANAQGLYFLPFNIITTIPFSFCLNN